MTPLSTYKGFEAFVRLDLAYVAPRLTALEEEMGGRQASCEPREVGVEADRARHSDVRRLCRANSKECGHLGTPDGPNESLEDI